jgi:hypothetical protein
MAHGIEGRPLGRGARRRAVAALDPYLSERQWGTVREDYIDNGDAWSYFTHDQARSRAYKWGDDGIAGFCAVWKGVDPILKERMFGLTNAEGNHGEDVKEYRMDLPTTALDGTRPPIAVVTGANRGSARRSPRSWRPPASRSTSVHVTPPAANAPSTRSAAGPNCWSWMSPTS